jgi:hypothetical protein
MQVELLRTQGKQPLILLRGAPRGLGEAHGDAWV